MPQISPSDLVDKFMLRLPDGMRGRIAVAAMQSNRSMNAEIIEALEKAFPEVPDLPEVLADIEYLVSVYKTDSEKRPDIRQVLATLKFQVGHQQSE
jgi:hypothetical protein